MSKVVIDANVFVSAIITEKGKPAQILKVCILTPGSLKLKETIKHTQDHKFLVAAVEEKADYIVSGDRHLRDLGTYKGIKIVSANEFLQILETKRRTK